MKKATFNRKGIIQELLDRFWILKKDDPELYFQVRDIQPDLRHFFAENFHYRLVVTHEMVKLEKAPTSLYEWIGSHKGPDFKTPRDFVFLFLLLAFLEGKRNDPQFSLGDICETIAASYPGETSITWKHGLGYHNRLSIIRVLKYAVKMKLLEVVDRDIEDFRENDEHDVLLEKTPYLPYFLRPFSFDVHQWESLDDISQHLIQTEKVGLSFRQSVFRKLFMEPILYLDELSEEEAKYIKQEGRDIEEYIEKHTYYSVERFRNAIMLVKHENQVRENLYPTDDSMMHKFVLSFCGRVKKRFNMGAVLHTFSRDIDIPFELVDRIINELREKDGSKWTRAFGETTTSELRYMLIPFLTEWKFGYQSDDFTLRLREGAFRVIGAYQE